MTPVQSAALVSLLLGGGAVALVHGLRRGPRSIAEMRVRMYGSTGAALAPGWAGSRAASGSVDWVGRRLGTGLAATGLTPTDVVTRVVVGAALGGTCVLMSVAALVATGTLPLSPLWLVLALASAGLAALVMWSDVRGKVERCRRELRQAANDLVQLVAVGLTTDQSVEEAVRFALHVGGTGAFDLLRSEIDAAPLRGIPLWEALRGLARTHSLRELDEFANSIERQGLQGVSIATSVATLAASMRAASLDSLERDADRANANLSGPTVGFVVATVVFLAYPLAQRVTEAFGG
jgi:hypothetical protein